MRSLYALVLAIVLTACSGGDTHLKPMATLTRGLVPGDRLECVETIFRIGLPIAGDFEAIGYVKRTFNCVLLND